MTNTLLDFSQRPDLALHARVVADVEAAAQALGIAPMIAGAFARDLHLHYGHGIQIQRATQDIDFALAVPDWAAFNALRERLIADGAFEGASKTAHRLRHRSGWPLDLVPFGGVESPDRKIVWPPQGEFVDWTQDDDFDYELAGPRMLGHDICRLLDPPGRELVANVLSQQVDSGQPGLLPNEMNPHEPDRAVAWLEALLRALHYPTTLKP